MKVVEEAIQLINGPRKKEYGDPVECFEQIALAWSQILGCKVQPQQVALCFIAVKAIREDANPKHDNRVDTLGYLFLSRLLEDNDGKDSNPLYS